MTRGAWARFRLNPSLQGSWRWLIGLIRVAVLFTVIVGVHLTRLSPDYLLGYYVLGFISSIWYLYSLRVRIPRQSLLTLAQILFDFGVVAATVSFTGGPRSLFIFLFVIVILEAELLLGLRMGYAFATLSTAVMFVLRWLPEGQEYSPLLWYGFLIESMAFFFTASISGYLDLRVRRIQQFQRDILDNMNSGFLITDERGTITAMNRAGMSILGHEGRCIGAPVQDVLRVASGHECPAITALRSQRDFSSYEFTALVDRDKPRLLGLTTSLLRDGSGRLTGLVASFSDLTEIARMRDDLKRQDRLAVVGELAAELAHEIRNPVAAIRGAMDEMTGNTHDARMVEALARIAVRESDQLNRIVSGFLDFARNPKLKRETFNLNELLLEVKEHLESKYAGKGTVRVNLALEGRDSMVSGSRGQLRQVFLNLAQNAAEAMNLDGTVEVSVQRTPGSVEVRVEDRGPGIEPDQVARVFEPFYTTKESGVGMGLAVCHRIVSAHDGTIRLLSREGGGATVIVRLPASRKE